MKKATFNLLLVISGIIAVDWIVNRPPAIGTIKEKAGPFGHRYTQFYHQAQQAIEFLINKQDGEAIAALYYKSSKYGMEIDIDLPWGYEGTGTGNGYGLAKIVKYHPEVLHDMQGLLNGMQVKTIGKKKIELVSKDYKATIKLVYDDLDKNWLLTMYKKDPSHKKRR